MLLKKYGDHIGEDAARMLDVIRTSTGRMNLLIDDLLSFSRVLRDSIAITEINMSKLANEVWHDVQAANEERELEARIATLLPAFGDKHLIRQVLSNLISNAVKFTKNRTMGVIEVSCRTELGKVVYSVKDNGVGFDMAYCHKLFGVFQRLHSQEEFEGTGVGLATVKRIIERHGGRIWAESDGEGRGSRLTFTLPLARPTP
jgi:two-component system sensor kinase